MKLMLCVGCLGEITEVMSELVLEPGDTIIVVTNTQCQGACEAAYDYAEEPH